MSDKECGCCHEIKFASDFSPEKNGAMGLKTYCKACMAEKIRARRRDPAVQARERAYNAAYRAAHPEWAKAQDSSPRKRAMNEIWARENLETRLMTRHRQLARQAGVRDDEFVLADWHELLEEFGCCAYCHARDVPLQIEHLTPLRRGGRHHRDNIVPACRACNKRKDSRTMLEYFGLQTQRERKAEARRVRALARAAA